jgi:hypothetical protein
MTLTSVNPVGAYFQGSPVYCGGATRDQIHKQFTAVEA